MGCLPRAGIHNQGIYEVGIERTGANTPSVVLYYNRVEFRIFCIRIYFNCSYHKA